ncbi:ras-related and estrogen-regulated growth inhibitor-like protein [Ruditapes philippinarum]|uniref:ras-related and estrogen-regulated growth inhibitor-like protein n=1 Tax=Ruditapes philippinarum TaxID=129788 RepID=UPI00295BE8F0|nr:ras-related and estrogen-regulated growth inhibitor-like protein [Ruditapes philippinarum]
MTSLRIAVFGDKNVGKSAVTVRFLTKRFIGEYNSDIDLLYRSSIKQEDYLTDIEILDTCSRSGKNNPSESHVQWADGFIVIYDICVKETFEVARHIIHSLHKMKSPFIVPMLLLANKRDLEHRREVGVDVGHELALEYGCQFYEVSAADVFMPISIAYQALLRDAKITQQQRSTILRRRRSSLMTVSKKLVSIFGKKETDLEKKRPSCDVVPDFALSI